MSRFPAYNYDSTARKLRYEEQPAFEVLPGGGRNTATSTASDAVMLFAKIVITAILVFAVIGVVRITLSSATVAVALEAKQIDAQIDDARDVGSALEVEQSSLSNPTRIKQEAAAIGMSTPATTTFMDLSGDVVVTDESGALSLTGSLEAVSEQEPVQLPQTDATVAGN